MLSGIQKRFKQESIPVLTILNICVSIAKRCQHWWEVGGGGSSSDQVWTDVQSWLPDVTTLGPCKVRSHVWGGGPCAVGSHVPGGPCAVGSHVWRGAVQWGPMHHGTPPQPQPHKQNDWLTDRHDWKHYLPTTSLAGGKNHLPFFYTYPENRTPFI